MIRIGIDFHGVSDTNPKFFSELSNLLVSSGHEVHIITSVGLDQTKKFLNDNNIKFTHYFSILEDAKSKGISITYNEKGNPFIDDEIWNNSKAEYCRSHAIHLHFDDSDIYPEYFTTPYARYHHTK